MAADIAANSARSLGPQALPAPQSFAPVLDAQKDLLTARLRNDSGSSPEQMFQPQAKTPKARRQEFTKTRYRDDLQQQDQARITHLREVCAQPKESSASSDSPFAAAPHVERQPNEAYVPTPPSPDREMSESSLEAPTRNEASKVATLQRTDAKIDRVQTASSAGTPEQDSAGRLSTPNAQAISGTTSKFEAATAKASPAQQVGRILASTPSAEQAGTPNALGTSGSKSGISTPHVEPKTPGAGTSEKTPAARSSQPEPANKEASPFEELVQSLRLRLGGRTSSAVMRLHPPQLGKIRIDVRLENNNMQVDVETDSDAARGLVADRAEQLRSALAGHGILIDRLTVSVAAAEVGDDSSYFANRGQPRMNSAPRSIGEADTRGSRPPRRAKLAELGSADRRGISRLDMKV